MAHTTADRLRLEEARRDWVGCVQAHIARSTGTLVAVLRSDEAGIESDPDLPWTTLCDDHSSVLCHRTLVAARSWASAPEEWCQPCRLSQSVLHCVCSQEENA